MRVNGLTLGFQCCGVIHAQEAVARIGVNVGALSFQLARLEGDDVDVALRKERRTTRVKTGLFSASHRHAGVKTMNNNRTYNRAGSS